MKTNLFSLILLTTLLCSCEVPKYLPNVDKIDVNQYGSYMTLYLTTGSSIHGELLALNYDSVIILSSMHNKDMTLVVPINRVKSYTLQYAQPRHYGVSIPVYTLITISHGLFLILTAPFNLIVTTAVTASGENAYMYRNKQATNENLRMFARFPQGIPPNVKLESLKRD